jgi:predicted nucleotidyltransferase
LLQVAGSSRKSNKVSFGSVRQETRKLKKRIKTIRLGVDTDASMQEERCIEHRLCELFEREEVIAR